MTPVAHDPSPPTTPRRACEPLDECIETFLAWTAVIGRAPETRAAYARELASFAAFVGVDSAADWSARAHLQRYQALLAKRVPNPRTRAGRLSTLRTFLAYCRDQEWIDDYRTGWITRPTYVESDARPIPTPLVRRLLRILPRTTTEDVGDRAFLELLLTSGCRISEVLALDRDALGTRQFRVLGKGGKWRTVYVTDRAHCAIREYVRLREDRNRALFINLRTGQRFRYHDARQVLVRLRRRFPDEACVAAFRNLHTARHTAATVLLEATGGDARLVQEVLGHATLRTLPGYTATSAERMRAGYRRFAAVIHTPLEQPPNGARMKTPVTPASVRRGVRRRDAAARRRPSGVRGVEW